MVERFHRQLKAALKARSPTDYAWNSNSLEGTTTAEMVYGTTLRLPGEFFTPSNSQRTSNPIDYVSQLLLD